MEAELNLDPDSNPDPESDPDPELITDPDPNLQIISDPAGSGSGCTTLVYKFNFIPILMSAVLKMLNVTFKKETKY